MGKKSLDQLELIDLTKGKKQPFARKVVVVAYYLKEHKPDRLTPHFLFTVIVPKQSEKITNDWHKAEHFRLPSGFSLIKGTREMYRHWQQEDIPPGFANYFQKMLSGKLPDKHVDNNINAEVPAVLSAIKESSEEAGIKLRNIKLILDLGVRKIKIDGCNRRVNSFAIELKKPANGKAIDSLAIEYFTLRALKLAAKQRTRYNIPLVRPSHVRFVEDIFVILGQQYEKNGKKLSKKAHSKKKEHSMIAKSRSGFTELVKDAKKGRFIAYKYSVKKTIKNIIKKSVRSRDKRKKLPVLCK